MQLVVDNICKQLVNKKLIDGISFKVNTTEVVGLLGANGAGKTTCFYAIIGLIKIDSGNILVNNISITNLPMYKRGELGIGYLPQEPSVFRRLSVQDNILAILQMNNKLSTQGRKIKLASLLEEFGLSKLKYSLSISLSGGERRRLEIARTLALDPKFILLDEPFAGIDPIAIAEIKGIIKYVADRGVGVLITDHNVRETLSICNSANILSDGKIIAQGSSQEIVKSELVKKVYLGKDFN